MQAIKETAKRMVNQTNLSPEHKAQMRIIIEGLLELQRKEIKEHLLEKGHGSGNFRRLITLL